MGIEDLRKRRDERRAKGVPPGVYPQHAKAAPAKSAVSLPVVPCAHRGDPLPARRDGGRRTWYECEHPAKPLGGEVCACKGCGPKCKGYAPDTGEPELKAPAPTLAGHFNPSLAKIGDAWVLASRVGWISSRLHLTRLGDDLAPTAAPVSLAFAHPLCKGGQEDPRLFTFRGKPHLSFTGVERVKGDVRTHQMLAELDADLKPVNVWAPTYAGRKSPKEKNWVFFEGDDGELYSVYSISPEHVVLRHRGTQAEEVARVPWNPVWGGLGHLRGGASPVRIGDEYYHFFHGMTWRADLKTKQYSLGVYTFDAKWPFAPRRGPALLLQPPADRPGWYASVVFPCGAALAEDGNWLVSYGIHDERHEVATWPREHVERMLDGATGGIPADLAPAIARATSESQPGWCSPEKAASAVDLVLRERPSVCVEVGVFGGRWTLAVAAALRHIGRGVVHAVDPWDTSPGAMGTHAADYLAWWRSVDLPGAKAKFLAARDEMGLSPWIRVREQPSQAAAWAFDRASIDLLHIDGNHSPEESTADVRQWLPLVRPGGWVAFDDSHWPSVAGALSLLDAACELIRDYGTWRLYRVR